ncbi:MAG TPA: MG2 domain-containing protein, partial [Beijerinckiaceae bacterium]|nr:MG2 domain-containing protein [Beijerinckiaceae bacterium]
MITSRQVQLDEGDRVIIEVAFNDKVNPAEVMKYLKLRGSDGHGVHFHPHGDVTAKRVRVITDPVTALFGHKGSPTIDLTVSKGLAGEAGPLGLEWDYSERLTVAQEVLATATEAYFPSHDEPFIQVRFNNPIDVETVKQVLSVSPAVAFTLSSGYQGVDLHGPFQPGTRYVVRIAQAPAGLSSRKAPRPTTLSALIPDREPGLWFESGVGYLSAEGNRTVLAHVVNMVDLRATVTRVYDNNLVAWRNAGRHGYWREIESFSRPVAVRDIHLPGHKNQKQDIRLSLDDLLPAGEARDGVYQISLRMTSPTAGRARLSESNDQDSDDDSSDYNYRYGGASTMVTLSDIGLTAKQGRGAVTVWATSLRTAKPLAGIHVRLFSNKSQMLGEGTTEKTGLATIVPLPAGPGEKVSVVIADQTPTAEVRDEGGDGVVAGEARKAAAHEAATNTTGRGLTWLDLRDSTVPLGDADVAGRPYLRHGYEAFVYTDRGVYRPGESVHLRAIVRGPDNAQPQRFPVRWQIRRPDLHDWKAQLAEIDVDGATSFDLALPADLPSGRWTANLG